MAVNVMITGCWDVIPCRLVGGYTCLGRPCCHHLQSRRSGSSFLQNFRVFTKLCGFTLTDTVILWQAA